MTRLVDAHLHLWDPSAQDYPWLAGQDALRRAFLPSDVDTAGIGPDDPDGVTLGGVIVVEAGARPDHAAAELAWIEKLAASWPLIRAVVAQAPLELGAAAEPVIAELAAHPLVTGVRRNAQDEPPGFLTRPDFVAGVTMLADAGLSFDACVRHHQLAELVRLVDLCPGVTFVLDHLGKPNIREGRWRPWHQDLARLATRDNVYAKLSGLTTEADPHRWQPNDIARYLTQALEVFGPTRCMFGSDWPVATLATDYRRWVDIVLGVLGGYAEPGRQAVLNGTVTQVHQLS
jgi:L-fuconolactonase